MIKKIKQVTIKDDPIWPELDLSWRIRKGREVYGLFNNKLNAVVCIAKMLYVPRDIYDLRETIGSGNILVPYTLWSYKKGSGSKLVRELLKEAKKQKARRLVTLSPLTEMARNFHLKNGAKEIRTNKRSRNFEYEL